MQFLSAFYAAALIAMATASPIEVGAPLAVDSKLQTRALRVDVWENPNKGGRHESLYTQEQQCLTFNNGWNDVISSLYVPAGFTCVFYTSNGCKEGAFTVAGGQYIDNLFNYPYKNGKSFDNILTSYRCSS